MFKRSLLAASFLAVAAALPQAATAATFTTLFTFPTRATGTALPSLVYDNGSLYGVNTYAGSQSTGELFKLTLSTQAYSVLYSYQDVNNVPFWPADVIQLGAKLFIASSGTDGNGGVGFISNYGLLSGKEKSVYQFRSGDAASPVSIVSVKNVIYGVGQSGGGLGDGAVFSVNATTGAQTTIASLNGAGDGSSAQAIVSVGGLLYGVASAGGASSDGTLFSVDPATGTITLLHSFTGTADGDQPTTLSTDAAGNLYGTTLSGGKAGYGVVYSYSTTTGTFTVLHQFLGKKDGRSPEAPVTYLNGSLYGTTYYGVENSQMTTPGTVFKMAAKTGLGYTTIHTFSGNGDGGFPASNLVLHGGVLYGATPDSLFGAATIFSVTP